MLTYELKKAPGIPLYEALYRCLRADILSGKLSAGEKLPSKRALSEHLRVSKITVETAYNQLLSEGYICSREKVGYFVEQTRHHAVPAVSYAPAPTETSAPILDFSGNGSAHFPFSVWSKLQRQTLLDYDQELLRPLPHQGCRVLRQAISRHLAQFRGMQVDPENIIIGAGTDFLYNLIIQLLGRDKTYAVENPGYDKICKIYTAGDVKWINAPMDSHGVLAQSLGNARVLHISPGHHFPLGIITPLARRQELLAWAAKSDSYIIEDDYDSEFRFHAHPLPAMQTLDPHGRVIYINTFSKTLAPSIRVAFMVLPPALMEKFRETLGFYSCTVSSFEQYTLARFLDEAYFEMHINRMRRFYRNRRDKVLSALKNCPWANKMTVLEEDAGLHFLLQVDTRLSDEELAALWAKAGIRVNPLSRYYHGNVPANRHHCLLINYSGLDEQQLYRLNHLPKL